MEKNVKKVRKFIVYAHTNKINGKKYIGITSKKPEERWGKDGNGYSQQKRFFNAIKKYGWENFKHEILYEGLTLSNALKKEFELSKENKTTLKGYGYNNEVGRGGNFNMSDETRAKHKENSAGSKNPMYGKRHTKATIEKLSKNAHKMIGIKNPVSRPIEGISIVDNNKLFFESANQAAKHFGFHNNSHFIECCKGKRKSCAGYKWQYINNK